MNFLSNILVKAGLTVENGTNLATVTGNVGIGNNSPSRKLDVTGTGGFTSSLIVGSATANTSHILSTGTGSIVWSSSSFGLLSSVPNDTHLISGRGSYSNMTGFGNTIFGYAPGNGLTTGTNNVLLGNSVGTGLTTGFGNVIVGNSYATNFPSSASRTLHFVNGYLNGDASTIPTSAHVFIGGGSTSGPLQTFYFGQMPFSSSASTVPITFHSPSGSGTNIGGANFTIAAGRGTGTGTPADIIFATSTSTVSGSTLQTLSNRVWIKGDNGRVGIGTSTPSTTLDINGDLTVAGVNNNAQANFISYGTNFSSNEFGTYNFRKFTPTTLRNDLNSYSLWNAVWYDLTSASYTTTDPDNRRAASIYAEVLLSGNATTKATQPISSIVLRTASFGTSTPINMSDYRYIDIRNIESGGISNHVIDNIYGIKISPMKGVANFNITNGWGVYQEGANDGNYFNGTVNIGSTSTNSSAIFNVTSTTRGILFPRMTSTQKNAIGTPATGLIVYDTTNSAPSYYDGSSWINIGTGGGSGTVTTVSVVSANGFAGTVANATTTPAITLTTTITGLLKGNGTAISAAVAGTDYLTTAITSLNGLTASTQTFVNDTNVTITSASTTHSIGWSGQLSIARGGTGASTATAAFDALNPMTTLGDMIYEASGPTAVRLAGNTSTTKQYLSQTGTGSISAAPAWSQIVLNDISTVSVSSPSTNQVLQFDGTNWVNATLSGSGITSLNGLTAGTQTFATGTSGTDFNISSTTSTHTFNIPDASLTARGLVTTGSQSFTGEKTFRGIGTTSATTALIVQDSAGAAILQCRNDKLIIFGNNTNIPTLQSNIAMNFNIGGLLTFTHSTGNLGNNVTQIRLASSAGASSGSNDINHFLLNGALNSTSTNTSVIRDLYLNHTFTSVTGSYRAIDIVAPATVTGGGSITYFIARTSTATIFQVQPTTITIGDAVDIVLNTTTGTKFGTSTSQKLSFYNKAPIVQPTTGTAAGTFTANTGTAVNDASTFSGWTIGSAIEALRNLGLLA